MIRAAEQLNCSVFELDNHPEKAFWIEKALTYRQGNAEGEFLMRKNPTYKKMLEKNG